MAGGWIALGRVDPAFILPYTGGAALLAGLALRPMRQAIVSLVGAVILASVAGWMGVAPTPADLFAHGVVAFAAVFAALALASAIARVTDRKWRIMALLLLAPAWWWVGETLLGLAYASPSKPGADVILVTALPLADQRSADARAGAPDAAIADMLSGKAWPAPILRWLARTHRTMRPAQLADALQGSARRVSSPILLLAHPPALTPRDLVAIDSFVRKGGRAVVLADAASHWPAPYPLGDARNPPVTTLLTPLMRHWGLVAGPPDASDRSVAIDVAKVRHRIRLWGSARLSILGSAEGVACRLVAEGRGADCRIGAGHALLLSDADWLHETQWIGGSDVSDDGRIIRPQAVRASAIAALDDMLQARRPGPIMPRFSPFLRPLFVG